jgi:hypothetical protein
MYGTRLGRADVARPGPGGLLLVGVCGVLLLAAALVSGLDGRAAGPGAVTTAVTACGLDVPGAAQVAYRLTNGDGARHGYRVHVSVTDGRSVLGSTVSLVNGVAGGATAQARALVPVASSATAATCAVHAEVFDAATGHHGPD